MNELVIKVSKKSLSYLVATKFGGIWAWEIQGGYVDSCQYTRAVIWGCVLAVFLGALTLLFSSLCAGLIGRTLSWLISALVTGQWGGYDEAVIVTLGVPSIFSILIILALILRSLSKLTIHPSETQLYQAWKEKHCHRVVELK